MKNVLTTLTLVLILASCSNSPETETGEMRTLQLLKQASNKSKGSEVFIDARNLLSREQVDAAKMPVLFVELASGQNGTLTPYPGQGDGQTWLGVDGATITMEQGILKASRGMGDDLMGSSSSMPSWAKINKNLQAHGRKFRYIDGNNKILERSFDCSIKKNDQKEIIKIWDVEFLVTKFEENCNSNGIEITNIFYVDIEGVVRKSSQYHSDTTGYIVTERLDR